MPTTVNSGTTPPGNTDDPIGEVFEFGTTWWDIQSGGQQINLGENGWPQVCWANGLTYAATLMHIYYQFMDDEDELQFYWGGQYGVQVDLGQKSNYSVIEVIDDNRAVIAGNTMDGSMDEYRAFVYADYFPITGAFWGYWLNPAPGGEYTINPRMTYAGEGLFHFLTVVPPPDTSERCDFGDLYYCTGEYFEWGNEWEFSEQELVASAVMWYDIEICPVTGRAAIAWIEPYCTGGDNQHDNDLIICLSEDGLSWDFSDTLNLTNWRDPLPEFLPDTVTANTDTFRCTTDINIIFDQNFSLQVFFTIRGYYTYPGSITWGNSYIMHWCEMYEGIFPAACGWYENGFYNPGQWSTYVQKPSGIIDYETGEMYCIYQRMLTSDEQTSFFPPIFTAITSDTSASGYPNSEIYLAISNPGYAWPHSGYKWDQGIDITNTYTPNAMGGDCESEIFPSAAPKAVDDMIHLTYILDRDAGTATFDEGWFTLNEVMYHRTPLPEQTPFYSLYWFDIHSGVEDQDIVGFTPRSYSLEQNYPNPFNDISCLEIHLPASCNLSLIVYDVTGREITRLFDGYQKAGIHRIYFDAEGLSSGVCFCVMEAGEFREVKKMVLLK